MSLSTREQQALDSIEDRLAGSDPRLASLLSTFTRLTAGEALPKRENIQACPSRNRVRGQLVWPLLWLVVSIALIAVALSVSRGSGSPGACSPLLAPALCAVPSPAHAVGPAAHEPSGQDIRVSP